MCADEAPAQPVDGGHVWQAAPPRGLDQCRCGTIRGAWYASDVRRPCPLARCGAREASGPRTCGLPPDHGGSIHAAIDPDGDTHAWARDPGEDVAPGPDVDAGHASLSDLVSVARASNASAVVDLLPDVDAGGAGDEVYLAPARALVAHGSALAVWPDTISQYRQREAATWAAGPSFRAAIDAARAPLLASIQHLMAGADRQSAEHGERMAALRRRHEAELAEAREQVAALETYRQLAREASDGYHAGAVKLIEERDQLRQHILDIDAHATPYGDLPEDPGYVGVYLLSAGALHRALGKIGHTAPNCQAEADLAEAIRERDQARAILDYALHLRTYGENAPGGNETWREFDLRCETYLRGETADDGSSP